jgi:hypothetical protein
MLRLLHHREEDGEMDNSRRVGVAKLHSSLVRKSHRGRKMANRKGPLLANERHQSHEPSSLDSRRDGMLTHRRTAALATADDFAVTIDQLAEQFDVFVIDVHRPRPVAVDENRVFSFGS